MIDYIKKIDFIGSSIQFKFKGSIRNQTLLGGIFSIIALTLIFIQLILDLTSLLTRSNPNAYLSTQKADSLLVNFSNNIPLMFTIVDRFVDIYPDQNKLFSMSGLGLNTIFNDTTKSFQHDIFNVKIEKCDRNYILNHFGNYSQYFLNNLKENYSFCVPLNQSNYWISGVYGQTPFQFLDLYVDYCNNETTNGTCYPIEHIKSTLNSFYMIVSMPDMYFDHNNFNNPGVYYVVSRTYPLSASIYNRYFQVFKTVNYLTDSGYLFSQVDQQNFFQQKALNIYSSLEYLSATNQSMGGVTVGLDSNIYDVYYRSYKKLTSIIAELGGSFNALFYISCLFNSYFEHINQNVEIFDICCDENNEKIYPLHRINQRFTDTFKSKKINLREILNRDLSVININFEKKSSVLEPRKNFQRSSNNKELDYKSSLLKSILFELNDIDVLVKTEIKIFDYFHCFRKDPNVIRKFEVIHHFSDQIFDIGFIFRNVLQSHIYISKLNNRYK